MSTVHPVSNPCYDIFILPFQEGGYNIRDAFVGRKINLVAQNHLSGPAPTPAEEMLTVGRQIAAFFIGMILITPIVNMIAMAILRNAKSEFLHPATVTNPNPPAPPPPAPNPNPNPPAPPPPAPNPNPPPPPPVHHQDMCERKEHGLTRLEEIEAIIQAEGHADPFPSLANVHFKCHSRIAQFDLNAFLDAHYRTDQHPIRLSEFRVWADVANDGTWHENSEALEMLWGRRNQNENYPTEVNRDNYQTRRKEWFERHLNTICTREAGERPQLEDVRCLLRNTLAYFKQNRDRIDLERQNVVAGSPEETELNTKERALKEQFQKFYNRFIDATHNCVDQVLSQMEEFVTDEIALKTDEAAEGPDAVHRKLFNQTCLALSKYRRELLRNILNEQDLTRAQAEAIGQGLHIREAGRFMEQEMADVQRMATKEMAEHYGLQGRLLNAGAAFEENNALRRARAHEAVEAFKVQYKPEEYLIAGLMAAPAGDPRAAAHTSLGLWCKQHFALDSEYEDDPNYHPNGPRMDDRLADPDLALGISIGGAFTPASVTLVMEAAGLIEPRAPQA